MKKGLILFFLCTMLVGCNSSIIFETNHAISNENEQLKQKITDLEQQLNNKNSDIEILIDKLNEVYDYKTRAGPYDWISAENIIIEEDKIIIELRNATISGIADTKSLEPLIGEDANVIEIVPTSISNIHLGDIIAYQLEDKIILHRVITIGYDETGWYALTKGDNNPEPDPEKVRFEQVKRVVVGIIY